MRWLTLLLLIAGCNQLYGLEPTDLVDDDRDDDGVADVLDNCPDTVNATQGDEDADSIGDACDNCPLVSNADQAALGDDDAVGDDCDPHPRSGGDCLIVLDTFDDVDAFAEHWTILSTAGDVPDVQADAGFVTLVPKPTQPVAIVVADDTELAIGGAYDTHVLGRVALATQDARIIVTTNATTPLGGLACGALSNGGTALVVVTASEQIVATAALSSVPILDTILLRVTATVDGYLACRVDYGVAVGTYRSALLNAPQTGRPGVGARLDPVRVDAFAAYQPRTPCPEPVLR